MKDYKKDLIMLQAAVETYVPVSVKLDKEFEHLFELVDRSTPKKPIFTGSGMPGARTWYTCPVCKENLLYGVKHCPDCDQCLDWIENEDYED